MNILLKSIAVTVAVAAGLLILTSLLSAYAYWTPNPADWPKDARGFAATLSGVLGVLVGVGYAVARAMQEDEKRYDRR